MSNHNIDPSGLEYQRLVTTLQALGLVKTSQPLIQPLTGGVSSMIVKVEENERIFCAKSALPKLKVEADWRVPVHRNQSEVAWMRQAARLVPDAVPEILGDDPVQNIFAMQWFDPSKHPVWKQQLLEEHVSVAFAAKVGRVLGEIHAGTAGSKSIATAFANDADFDALRLDPYLRATAKIHPEVGNNLLVLANVTAQSRHALIHGDVSPKNILDGPKGPIFLDAECATYGDPAFDLAFCLNHLILKSVHLPGSVGRLADCFTKLAEHYLSSVTWEPTTDIESRAAALLPALALARVDGKSPVEYLNVAAQQQLRNIALPLIKQPVSQLDEFLAIWQENLA